MDLLEKHLTKEILHQIDCKIALTKLRTMFENSFNSGLRERIQKYTVFNAQSFKDTIIDDMDFIEKYMLETILHQQEIQKLLTECNSETAFNKSVKESSLDSETKDVQVIKYKMSKAKERCMTYFRPFHLHLQVLSKEDLKGTRIKHGFKRAFLSLFGQDNETFTSTVLLNVDQLQKQLDKDEFKEDGSMASFWVINRQFQIFIDLQVSLDYDSQMTDKTRHKRLCDRRVNKRQMQTQESKVDLGKALDAGLVVTERSGTESEVQDTRSMLGNDTDADDADIRLIYDEEPMAKALNSGQHGQILNETSNKAKIYHDIKENEHLKQTYKDLYDSIKKTQVQTKDHNDSLIAQMNKKSIENADLKAQIQEKVFAIAALKNELRKLKGNSVDTKFAKLSVLGKPILQPLRNQSVVRQPTAFKSERPKISKPRFAFEVDVKKDLPKPVTQHYLPKGREFVFAKPNHVIASSESRNSSKNMPRFSSSDMVHNHYLEEAKKKTQEKERNLKSSVMHSTRLQNTTNGSKPKPRINNQTTRSLPVSKSSYVTSNVVPLVDHFRNASPFLDSKHFICSTCHKCVFNANHGACIIKFLKEVNSCAKIQSHKTRSSNKPVEQKSHTQKPGRQIFTRHRISPNKSSVVYEKTSLRSCLRWKPTGRIFKYVGLRWIPTGKLFDSCTSKVDSEPPHGSNVDISKIHVCKQTLDISAVQASNLNVKCCLNKSVKPRTITSTEVPAYMIVMTSMIELERLFGPLFDEYFNGENQVVSKSSAVTTADASDKRQQQPDSTSSTSTLTTIVTGDENFDL
ncbi:hypothetical protein Tco_0514989 [Tanacetum coccineum]